MEVDVILGLQFGSESKGLVAVNLAKQIKYDAIISVNSCQAGHTGYHKAQDGSWIKVINRQLPSAFPYTDKVVISAGAMIKPHVLKEEIAMIEALGFDIRHKLYIDAQAGITGDDAGEHEKELVKEIGSTGEGVGYSISERVMRRGLLAKDLPELADFGTICNTWKLYSANDNILLEGCQGFGLSLYHSFYPCCTSRDTGVAAFMSYAGLPVRNIRDIYGVARTYPIRVGTVVKSSGPMNDEVDWDYVTKASGYKIPLIEKTTVTGRVRRVCKWDDSLVAKAVYINSVNKICLTFVNYISAEDEGISVFENLSQKSKTFINSLHNRYPITHFSTDRYNLYKI